MIRIARLGRRLHAAALLLLVTHAGSASAHFLFVRISPVAEGGRRAEVYFSEKAEAGDPRYVAKLAGTKLWAQSEPGVFVQIPVKVGVDRLKAPLPNATALSVVGVCEYGVRPGKTPFLLRYYPKAVAGPASEVNAFRQGTEVPFEILARFEGDEVVFVVLHEGKPVPGAKLVTIDRDLVNKTLTADGDGKARWKPGKGEFSVYSERILKTPGERDGAKYVEIREFATLAFRHPLERDDADSEAVELFEKAVAARAQWRDFAGFSADIEGYAEGRDFAGTVEVAPDGKATLKLDDASHAKWVADQLGSIVLHRKAEAPSADRPVLRFADEDEAHPLGRLLEFEGGRFASSYRIKDGRISSVNRAMGASNLTILTLDNVRNPEGRDLPRSYVVEVWDAGTGVLTKSETYRDTWTRVGAVDLPAEHVVTTSGADEAAIRSFKLSGHRLPAPAK